MFVISRNLKLFAVLAIFYTIIFQYYYNAYLALNRWEGVLITAIVYFICMFGTGLVLGMTDSVRNSRIDQGFQYHLVTYIIVNALSITWKLIGLSPEVSILGVFLNAFSWGIGLLVHYLVIRNYIKDMNPEEIFE